jgi:hypothetical protein
MSKELECNRARILRLLKDLPEVSAESALHFFKAKQIRPFEPFHVDSPESVVKAIVDYFGPENFMSANATYYREPVCALWVEFVALTGGYSFQDTTRAFVVRTNESEFLYTLEAYSELLH